MYAGQFRSELCATTAIFYTRQSLYPRRSNSVPSQLQQILAATNYKAVFSRVAWGDFRPDPAIRGRAVRTNVG